MNFPNMVPAESPFDSFRTSAFFEIVAATRRSSSATVASRRRLSALRAGRVAVVLALLLNFSVALVGLGSSSRAATPVADYPPAAGRVSFGDALRVIRAASGRARSRPDAAGKQGGALTRTTSRGCKSPDGFILRYGLPSDRGFLRIFAPLARNNTAETSFIGNTL